MHSGANRRMDSNLKTLRSFKLEQSVILEFKILIYAHVSNLYAQPISTAFRLIYEEFYANLFNTEKNVSSRKSYKYLFHAGSAISAGDGVARWTGAPLRAALWVQRRKMRQ